MFHQRGRRDERSRVEIQHKIASLMLSDNPIILELKTPIEFDMTSHVLHG